MRSHVGLGGERSILYKGVKTLRGSRKGKGPKRTISTCSRLGPLQLVSEPDTRHCASNEAKPQRGVDRRCHTSKDVEPRRGVGVPHRMEKGMSINAGEDARPRRGWIVRFHID